MLGTSEDNSAVQVIPSPTALVSYFQVLFLDFFKVLQQLCVVGTSGHDCTVEHDAGSFPDGTPVYSNTPWDMDGELTFRNGSGADVAGTSPTRNSPWRTPSSRIESI